MLNTNNKIILDKTKAVLIEQLKSSGWYNSFKSFIYSSEFDEIISTLIINVKEGKNFLPLVIEIFNCFIECPFDKLKVLFLLDQPYSKINIPDGIGLSCSKSEKEEYALTQILNEIQKTIPDSKRTLDLREWSGQGVLLLNTALTRDYPENNKKNHFDLWRPLITFLIDYLNANHKLIYVLFGDNALTYKELIDEENIIYTTSMPNNYPLKHIPDWESNDLFNKINNDLTDKILW